MEQLPKIVLERLQAGAKGKIGVHPDPDLLTAFAENSLTERERLPLLEHLSSCVDCREVVSLAQPELMLAYAAAAAAVPACPAPSRPRWSSRLVFSWGAVAACAVIGVVLLRYQTREKKFAQIASEQAAPGMNAGQISNAEESSAKAKIQPASPASDNELSARLEAPAPPRSKSVARADKDSDRAAVGGIPEQLMSKKLSAAGTGSGQALGGMAARPSQPIPQVSEQVAVTAEAGAVAAAPARQEDLPLEARSSPAKEADKDFAAAAAPPAAQQNKPAAPNSSANADSRATTSLDSISGFVVEKSKLETAQVAANQKRALARVSSNYIPTRWSISSDGSTLLRSTDEGQTWNAVNVANNLILRAVAALGPEVWAGGKGGALYHSSDMGAHWTQVKPIADGVALTADIVSLDFPDPAHGKLTTAEGKVWTTSDGGKNWHVQ